MSSPGRKRQRQVVKTMGIEYYGFAFFVFLLICGLVFLCKRLFADTKRQNVLLDEKESKLLRLYQTVEEAMDEFYDTVAEAKGEIAAQARALPAPAEQEPAQAPVRESPRKPARGRAKEEEPSVVVNFKQALAELEEGLSEEEPEPVGRHEGILQLAKQGKTRVQIAQELGITQNEVDLVIGIHKKK